MLATVARWLGIGKLQAVVAVSAAVLILALAGALYFTIGRWESATARAATYAAALDIARQTNEANAREMEFYQAEIGRQARIAGEARAAAETWRQRVTKAVMTTGAKHAGATCPALDDFLDQLLERRADGADPRASDARPD